MKSTPSVSGDKQPARTTTAAPVRGRVVLREGDVVSRLLITTLGSFLARLERERRALYNFDLDLASVFDVVAIGAIEPALRDPNFRAAHGNFDTVVGVEGQRGINAMSVAAATGIPRETVRRKLKRLVERGFIQEKTKGHYIVTPGRLQTADFQTTYARATRDTLRFFNECLEHGAVQWVPGGEPNKTPSKE